MQLCPLNRLLSQQILRDVRMAGSGMLHRSTRSTDERQLTLIGFSIAFVLPLLGGWLADSADRIEMALIPSLIFMVAALAALGRTAHYPTYE